MKNTGTLADAAAKAHLTPSEFGAVRTWLAEQLVAQEYAKLGQGGHTQNQVPLRRVFVDLPVIDSMSGEFTIESRVLFLGKLLSSSPLNLRNACKPRDAGTLPKSDNSGDENLEEQKHNIRFYRGRSSGFGAILLIGGPGQGKSTLGQLACQLHRAALLKPLEEELTSTQRELVHSFEPVQPEIKAKLQPLDLPKRPFLPLQIALPDLAVWLAKEQQTGIASDQPPALLRFIADLPSAKMSHLSAENLLELATHMPSLLVSEIFKLVVA